MKKALSFLTVFIFSLLVACGGGAPDVVQEPSLEEQLISNLSTVTMAEGPSFSEKKATITEIEEWVLFTAQAAFEGNQGLIEQAMTQLDETKNPNFTNLSMGGPLGGTVSGSGQGKGEVLHLDSTFSDFAYTENSHDSAEENESLEQQEETKKQITLNGSSTEDYQMDTEKGEGFFSVDLATTTSTSGTYSAKISFSLQASFETHEEKGTTPIEISGLAAVESGSQVLICEFTTFTFAGTERYHGANCKEKVDVQETAAPSTTQGGGGL